MSALELLTVIISVLALLAAMVMAILCFRLRGLAVDLAAAVEAFEAEAIPAAEQLRMVAESAVHDVARVEALLDLSESIGTRVDSATDATYRALTSPIIKGVAIASGTRRAAGRLRGS